jgi:hypothetical protein
VNGLWRAISQLNEFIYSELHKLTLRLGSIRARVTELERRMTVLEEKWKEVDDE